ncbi:MAG TPA: PfkB family carbohydrate kinase [Gaiellaceae bacterium]
MTSPYVVCVGLATRDTIAAVPRHPEPEDRVEATEIALAGGGPAATAAVTLARLGVEVALVGSIGDDPVGAEIRAGLERERVDVSCLRVVPGVRSPESLILVGDGTRAIVHDPRTPPVALDARADELCRGAAWVHADHTGYSAARGLRDVRLSIDAGIPLADLDLSGVALYAPTEAALAEAFPGGARDALAAGAELVVATRGAEGSAAWTQAQEVVAEAYRGDVEIVSTLGAGDVFHGALLAGLVRDLPLGEALARANACAALSCRALDGRSAIPTLDELEDSLAWATASR